MSAIEKNLSTSDLQAENNLLLIQLNQIQEELEQYYLQNKHQSEQVLLLENRVKRLQQLPVPELTFLQKCTDHLGYSNHRDIAEIRNSEYMDIAWYLEQNPDVKQSGMDAVDHYYKYGWKEGRAPGPAFNSSAYLKNYPDVANANVEPLLHYLRYGKDERRSCFGSSPLGSGSVLLTQIETLRSERSSAASQLHQLRQDHQGLQSKYQLLTNNHQQLEKSYQQKRDNWKTAEAAYQKQIQQRDAEVEQLKRIVLLHEQTLAQHRIDHATWESSTEQNQKNMLQQEGVIAQLQSHILELKVELTQLSNRYEQVKELQRVEREVWEKAEVVYKDQSRQQGALIEQLQSHTAQLQTHIGDKFNSLLDEQKSQLDLVEKTLNKAFTTNIINATRQIESFIGVQNYLKDGVYPFDFHGWPISPDIALVLLGLIENNNYDLIIEFGSGTSTALFAEALVKKSQRLTPQAQPFLRSGESNSQAMQVYYEPSSSDLPRRIVTFEHNKKYYAQTQEQLEKMNLEQVVDLIYAPLVDYQFKDGSQYLYYHCSEKLQELARTLKGRQANILVLVDGPPGKTNKNARFPALPHLLMSLPEHSFTIVMDDYLRGDEKETADLWIKILKERSMIYKIEEIVCEKGCAVITIGS